MTPSAMKNHQWPPERMMDWTRAHNEENAMREIWENALPASGLRYRIVHQTPHGTVIQDVTPSWPEPTARACRHCGGEAFVRDHCPNCGAPREGGR